MLPFVPSLALRRFQYGVLIRCDQTRAVSLGTLLRLLLEVALAVGLFRFSGWDGIIVASTAQFQTGVVFEAIYATSTSKTRCTSESGDCQFRATLLCPGNGLCASTCPWC